MGSGRVGILIVSHGDLSEHFLKAARLIYQDEDLGDIQTLSVSAKSDREQVLASVHESLGRFGGGTDRILAMCDMHGATPSRLVCDHGFDGLEIRCVFGLNLSMLLDCINYRMEGADLEELAERICRTGRDAIFTRAAGDNGAR